MSSHNGWFSGGDVAFVIDRRSHQIQVYRPAYPALVGEGSKGFVQLVWQPRSALSSRVEKAIDLNGDGIVDCEISFTNPPILTAPVLSVKPKSPWVSAVYESKTTSLEGVLIEKAKDTIFVRIPIKKSP